MLNVGATAPDFMLRDQNQQLVTLRGYCAKNGVTVFSVGSRASARASWTSCVITCPSLRTTTAPRLRARHPLTRSGHDAERIHVSLLSDFLATRRGQISTASSTQAGIANRGHLVSIGQGSFGSPRRSSRVKFAISGRGPTLGGAYGR